MGQKFFDANEFTESPIKSIMRTYVFNFNVFGSKTDHFFKVRRNFVEAQDNYFFNELFSPNEYQYEEIIYGYPNERFRDQNALLADSLLTVYFKMDDEETYTSRSVYTVVDAMSNVGGLVGVISALMQVLLTGLEETFFYASVIGKLFLYDKRDVPST